MIIDPCYEESFSWSMSFVVSEAPNAFEGLSSDAYDPVPGHISPYEKSSPIVKEGHKVFVHRSDEEIEDRKPEFRGLKVAWEVVEDDIEPQVSISFEIENCFVKLRNRGITVIEGYAGKRRNRLKFMDSPPSVLTTFKFPLQLLSCPSPASEVQAHHAQALLHLRNYIFSLPDFTDTTTASLRHRCMGILADSYKVYMKLVEDLDLAAGKMCPEHEWDSKEREMMKFLREIEERETLEKVCVYSVVTKSSSGAKSDLRCCYLNLLATKHNTVPFLAQELVPGFTYENIQSIDEVVTLIESKVEKPEDEEVEQFRSKINRVKVPKQRRTPVLSAEFVARIQSKILGF